MKFALINPRWKFEESIYLGCTEPHLPLEFGYSRALLKQQGHDVLLLNAHQDDLTDYDLLQEIETFKPEIIAITTANSYLFWRCAQPELQIPLILAEQLRPHCNFLIAVGPHASATPGATLQKLNVNAVILGECEEILPLFAESLDHLELIPSIAYWAGDRVQIQGGPRSSNMLMLPALIWEDHAVARHQHHHHRFDAQPCGPGVEMEVSRSWPSYCSFCTKENFRYLCRTRPLEKILQEIDSFLRQGVEYIYFIDEIFLPDRKLLDALVTRDFCFGIQTRIDLWSSELLELLGKAGCVSIEAGVESIVEEGHELVDTKCSGTTSQISEKLIFAKQHVPFVQANLLESRSEPEGEVQQWRQYLIEHGVCANEPVPVFPYPGSPDYTKIWGAPDDYAWERAQNYYLKLLDRISNIQEPKPPFLTDLEAAPN
jgi:B12-binding domain/radical SAM domain protein of rhizo-twelve system